VDALWDLAERNGVVRGESRGDGDAVCLGDDLGPVLGEDLTAVLGAVFGADFGVYFGDDLGVAFDVFDWSDGESLGDVLGPFLGELRGDVRGGTTPLTTGLGAGLANASRRGEFICPSVTITSASSWFKKFFVRRLRLGKTRGAITTGVLGFLGCFIRWGVAIGRVAVGGAAAGAARCKFLTIEGLLFCIF
jgi:hypothetical protein